MRHHQLSILPWMGLPWMGLFLLGLLGVGVWGAAPPARGDSPAPGQTPDYLEQIKPLLLSKCVSCHGPLRQEGGLRVDTAALLLDGGDSGEVVVAEEPDQSYLLDRITAEHGEDRMPPESEGEALTAEQIELFRRWIAAGLPAPEAEEPLPPPEEHWAYQPIERPEVPPAAADPLGEPRNPIDQFLAIAHQQAGVTAAPRADAATLLRRITMDLTGLPPRPDELAEFMADDSPEAYARVVDRLLDSPRFGERWGRHWMDVWRYSDWDGYKNELRGSQRHIWHWRDWIIESLNEDKGYDQMILEMLAGDELAPEDPDTLRATGFLARNYHHSNRDIWLDATVEHTAKAFLGMTIACARCHDHKYDPISQREYYAFRAIFEPHRVRSDRIAGQPNVAQDALPRAFDAEPEAETYLYIQGNEKRPDKEHPLAPAVPAFFDRPLSIEPVSLPLQAYFPAAAEHVEREDLAAAARRVEAAQKALDALAPAKESSDEQAAASNGELELARLKLSAARAAEQSLARRWDADRAKHTDQPAEETERLAAAAATAERQAKLLEAELQVAEKERAAEKAEQAAQAAADKQVAAADKPADAADAADAKKQQAAVAKLQKAAEQASKELAAAREALTAAQTAAGETATGEESHEYTAVGEAYPRQSTGRRLALARWIASRDNPLTARVAVNHVWLRHFGTPLVDRVFDFGLEAPRPAHADLLDWLAAELVDSGWSLKHLHRLIVHSQAYTAASSGLAVTEPVGLRQSAKIDPDNRLFWRANTRRLDAEVIRDSLFFVSGSLDLTLGGPEIPATEGETVPRRSVYFQHAYEKQMTMLTLFDAASPNECYRRGSSILPQQALALSNSTASLTQARRLARQLCSAPIDAAATGEEAGASEPLLPAEAFIRAAFARVLSRPPRAAEVQLCLEFLDRQQRLLADPAQLTASAGKAAPQLAPAEDPAVRARENLLHVLLNHNDFVTLR
ncbi:PSD1 and planctomycete cytochrome C domain-containing protein [Candidatus Laterigemmans baculatus]|uniref:PSD1 and planctomycete cytochrome C domain-containing protein n=1 Tax=Candidatus Laterigemmans baculatus TaxID=2770505 RepID=UPI00193B76FE|nr:PSD1 and planctomycete cytochrome C domain-containing protein [Candidatus Laterigemmans baculatus]